MQKMARAGRGWVFTTGTLRAFAKVAAFKLNALHTEDSSSVTRIREVGLVRYVLGGNFSLGDERTGAHDYVRCAFLDSLAMGQGL